MTDSEKLDLLLNQMTAMQSQMFTMQSDISAIQSDLRKTEKRLTDRIKTAEELILDEVDRVHNHLIAHTHDTSKHTA